MQESNRKIRRYSRQICKKGIGRKGGIVGRYAKKV